ncbi:hypothetical protein AB0E88_27540 [Streptomyces sp. NPDC028635]
MAGFGDIFAATGSVLGTAVITAVIVAAIVAVLRCNRGVFRA